MSQIKKIGKRMEITPQPERLGGVLPAEFGDESINLNQLKGYGSTKPYRKYVALLNQSGTDAPVATVLENTIGNVVWTRIIDGNYAGTLTGAFTNNKTVVITAALPGVVTAGVGGATTTPFVLCNRDTDSVYLITFENGAAPTDSWLSEFLIEIRVYQ